MILVLLFDIKMSFVVGKTVHAFKSLISLFMKKWTWSFHENLSCYTFICNSENGQRWIILSTTDIFHYYYKHIFFYAFELQPRVSAQLSTWSFASKTGKLFLHALRVLGKCPISHQAQSKLMSSSKLRARFVHGRRKHPPWRVTPSYGVLGSGM